MYWRGSHLYDFWPIFTLVEKCASVEWWVRSKLTRQALASHSSRWFFSWHGSDKSICEHSHFYANIARLNDCLIRIPSKHSSNTLVCLLWISMRQTLVFTILHMAWALDGKKSKAIDNSNAASKFIEVPLCPLTLRFMTFLAQMFYFFEGNWVLGGICLLLWLSTNNNFHSF